MHVITIANYKGGTGKSTTVAFLAHAFEQLGLKVAIVDADPQGSLLGWADQGDFTIPSMGLPTNKIHRQLKGIVGDSFDVVLIDTPGFKDSAGIVYSALRASQMVVVTMAPTMVELDTVVNILDAVNEIEELVDREIATRVLLNRTVTNASSTDIVRKALGAEVGVEVFGTTISRRESIAQAGNMPVTGNLFGHISLANEILETLNQ